ncbi:hypothetical protein [Faecalibacillus intestinalis]|uniref:hypothetical protein n=1 Tax=Faecalibacillus intestinalis TaxID=1982626 RepID=UPI00352126C3
MFLFKSYFYNYALGILFFFLITSQASLQHSQSLRKKYKLTDALQLDLAGTFLSRIIFITIMMVIFPLCFVAYDYCNNNFQKYLFVNSGLFSILWLWITGMIIKTVYYFIIKKVNCLKVLNLDKYFKSNKFLWVMCPTIYGIFFGINDIKITFTILAIVLGKYVWLDSFEIFSLTSIKDKISILSKKYRVDIYLLIYFSIITLYLIYRWYSIKDISIINTNYPLITLILIALVVKKILYFFIYNSMISYVDYLKESNKN